MEDYSGHHADINLRLARELTARGFKVTIYAHKKFISRELDLDVRPTFSYGAYEFLSLLEEQMSSSLSINIFDGMAAYFERELQAIEPVDITVIPTLFAHQLRALGSKKLALGKVFAGLHAHPNFQNPNGRVFWKMAFLKARPKLPEISLGVFETELILEYEQLLPAGAFEIHEFPIPHDGSELGTLRNRLLNVGVLGHQRSDKGLSAIPKTIKSCLDLGFDITVQDSAGKLANLVQPSQKVKVLGHVRSMGDLIRECDVTLLDYSPEVYRYSGSGIAWESLASGVPVLAPKGTTISRLLRQYNTGATFCATDRNAKFRVLQEMRDTYSDHLERAELARRQYREKHGTKRFADLICRGL